MIQSLTTPHFKLQYDDTKTPNGQQLIQALQQTCEGDYARLKEMFGAEPSAQVTVTVDNGVGGQENGKDITHDGDAGRGSSGDFDYLRNSFIAELAEIFMYAQNKQWNPADSKGEALSRVLAQFFYPGGQQPSFTVHQWVDDLPDGQTPTKDGLHTGPEGLEDWISNTDDNDTRAKSIGCGVAFLHYLHYHVGYSFKEIVSMAGATLEDIYRGLTGSSGGFQPFAALVRQTFPKGQPSNLNGDNKTPNSDQFFPLPSNSFSSGFLIQGHFGAKGNFEVVVPDVAGLSHYDRNNDDPNLPWSGPFSFGSQLGRIDGPVSLIQSNYGLPGNLEVVAVAGSDLVSFWRDSGPAFTWNGPYTIHQGVRDVPALVQSRFGQRGNFEVVAPVLDGLIHLWRNNDDPAMPWSDPTPFGAGIGLVDAVCMIQSDYGVPGNLEVIARVADQLFHFWRDSGPNASWKGPFPILAGITGGPAGAAWRPNLSLIQSRFGRQGNFELVAPARNGGIVHVWRNNDDPAMPWSAPTVFGTDLGQVDAVSVIQSNYGDLGNLEVVAKVGDELASFWRGDGPDLVWNGPNVFASGPHTGGGGSGGGGSGGGGSGGGGGHPPHEQ
ncbi:MAG TPA: hypothetical protein VFW71_04265 [Actinomycetota bacterium]|nr:hypothetical protein [Actinomycetota bacterium]